MIRVKYESDEWSGKIKSKGLTHNVDACEILTYDMIAEKSKQKAENRPTNATMVKQLQFRLNPQHTVHSKSIEKRFDVTSNKRFQVDNNTFPYGWKGPLH